MPPVAIADAAERLTRELSSDTSVVTVGIAEREGKIIVYTAKRTSKHLKQKLPKRFEGYGVIIKRFGRPFPA